MTESPTTSEIEQIEHEGALLATIVRGNYNLPGLNFVTDEKQAFQVGIHVVPKETKYRAHMTYPFDKIENLNPNKIYYVKKGKANINFYTSGKQKVKSEIINQGDFVIFISGGHNLEIVEDAQIIEIKQGPYRGVDKDKDFFEDSPSKSI